LGREETEWVLSNYPTKLKAIASAALDTSPQRTLGLLLDAAAAARDETCWPGRIQELMPEIKRWILGAKSNDNEASRRRELLATSLEKWFTATRNLFVAVQAAELVLSTKYEDTSTPPGEPMTVTFHLGVVAQDQLSKIAGLWSKVLPIPAPSTSSSRRRHRRHLSPMDSSKPPRQGHTARV